MKSFVLAVLGGILVVVLGVTFLLASVQRSDASTCLADPSNYPAEGVNGYKGDQLANAAAIIGAAQQLSLGEDAQIIGVMTAMGESSLKNITYGDDINGVTNPDGTEVEVEMDATFTVTSIDKDGDHDGSEQDLNDTQTAPTA